MLERRWLGIDSALQPLSFYSWLGNGLLPVTNGHEVPLSGRTN